MPRQNRVTPFSTIEAVPSRGTLMGNRGILHDERGRLGVARWRHPHWVTCVLEFKGRRRPVMQPHAYTELFFTDTYWPDFSAECLDEAIASYQHRERRFGRTGAQLAEKTN